MHGILHVIKPDGSIVRHEVDGVPSVRELQALVSGYFEQIPAFATYPMESNRVQCVAFCNEEGKYLDLPYNEVATRLWGEAIGAPPVDYLVGTIVVVTGDDELLSSI